MLKLGERRGSVRHRMDQARDDLYRAMWREAARTVGADVNELRDGFYEIRRGDRVTRVWQNLLPLDDPVTLRIAANKPLVHALLSARGLPVPRHRAFTLATIGDAIQFLHEVKADCVVKPAVGTGAGAGVTTRVRTRRDLVRAAIFASAFAPRLLIERQHPGESYRLLYLDGTLLDAVRRRPPQVVGDGRSTVRQLIDAENRRRLDRAGVASPWLISVDPDCRARL